MAKDLVRTRRYIQKFYQMRTQLQAVGLRIQTMSSNQAMADAMKGVTKAMRSMNKAVNLPELTKIMMDFEKESDMMDMKEEMMNDAIDDVGVRSDTKNEKASLAKHTLYFPIALYSILWYKEYIQTIYCSSYFTTINEILYINQNIDEEDDEMESDNIVNQVLDEIGINLNQSLVDAPASKLGGGKVPAQAVEEPMMAGADASLQERLNNLRRD
ncbi:UNVERIFIED_CONTAM: hypothetical protein HDU68_007281 [Siphonaria sp. JEL0065]|nr:hypothetical protein HDU68_007281 [Siphonaria sp. JEL0065]